MSVRDILWESWSMTRSQRAASILTALVVAALCATVLLTAGRTNASQAQILQTIDSRASRAIIVRIEPQAQINMGAVSRLTSIAELEWVGAFGTVSDLHNPDKGTGTQVASRTIIAYDLAGGDLDPRYDSFSLATATPAAASQLGLIDGVGYLAGDGVDTTVTSTTDLPDFLAALDPIILIPTPDEDPYLQEPVALIIAVPTSPEHVPAVVETLRSILAPAESDAISIDSSQQLNTLRSLVETQLGGAYQSLIIGVFVILLFLVTALLYGLVMIRRRDFGRRRALGATRSLIVGLVVMSTGICAIVAAAGGTALALIALVIAGDPLPAADFIGATMVLAAISALAGAVLPAISASRRDPLTELRVP